MKRTIRYLVALMVVIAFTACQSWFTSPVEKGERASFTVYTYDEYGSPAGFGSGFFVGAEGVGITSYHVLDKCVKALVKTHDGSEYEVESIVGASSSKDLVLFTVVNPDKRKFDVLTLTDKVPAKGDKVICISAPMGLGSSVSEGIVSAYRDDTPAATVQVTLPVSEGSSGGAIIDTKGRVFAVATSQITDGQNLNFGVIIDTNFRYTLDGKEFGRKNPKFNNSNFIILNQYSDKRTDLLLNAVEFSPTATTLYFTYTNLHLNECAWWSLWCSVGNSASNFFIEDRQTHDKYLLTSSSLPSGSDRPLNVGVGQSVRFKVNFPSTRIPYRSINIMWQEGLRDNRFTNIDLELLKQRLTTDDNAFTRHYALRRAADKHDINESFSILKAALEIAPYDPVALNTLGVYAWILGNNHDAEQYFTRSIEQNPNDELAYLNRAKVIAAQNRFEDAVADMTEAIKLVGDNPDYYRLRALYAFGEEAFSAAKADIDSYFTMIGGATDSAAAYELRARIHIELGNRQAAIDDIQVAYKLSTDMELDNRLKVLYEKI